MASPKSPAAWRLSWRGMCLRGKASNRSVNRDAEAAVGYWRQALALDGENAFDLCFLAEDLLSLEKQDEALQAAARALALDDSSYIAHRVAARIHAERGDHATARHHILRSLENEPVGPNRLGDAVNSVLRALSVIPWVRRRLNQEQIRCDCPDASLRWWREWTQEYLTWYSKNILGNSDDTVH